MEENERGPADGAPQPQPWRDQQDGRRRRGRRGRGGRGPYGGPPYAGPPREDDEGSSQMREVGAYERRQRQTQQRGGWRGGGSFGAPQRSGGQAFRGPRPGGGMRGGPRQQRYQEMVRRATAGPRAVPPEEGGEPIAGPHAVLEALRAGRAIRRLYVASERGQRTGVVADVIREAQERRLQIRFIDRIDVDRLSPGVEHQGIVAIAEGRAGVDLDELLLHLDTLTEPPLLLVIDSLQDPQNFGVLLRSAEGAGADGVVIPRHRQVGLTPAVARTSAGASEHLLIAEVANLRQAIDALKQKGVWVVGADGTGDVDWDAVDYRGATAIVVGNEGEGIRRLVLEACDQVVRIPMQGRVASLNAAAAGTAILFEALRQRIRDAAPPVVEPRPKLEAEPETEAELLADEISEDEGAEATVEPALREEMVDEGGPPDEVASAAEHAEEPTAEARPVRPARKRTSKTTAAKTAKRTPRKKAS